ncbi:MAG: hypothetical protein FWF16_07975, partial [Microbacteriaceae bacterium]|nr:hypothetical protein [Microbacteriaceae bacterium]
ISRASLLKVPRRVGVAGGERKYAAIRGAVLGGWVNILVTDKATAVRLLEDGQGALAKTSRRKKA